MKNKTLIYVGVGVAVGYLAAKFVFAPKKSSFDGKNGVSLKDKHNKKTSGYSGCGNCGSM
jgi:opacity protein-like surface antigen